MYDQSGNYTAIAGIVVFILSKLGVNATVSDILAVIGAIVSVIGIVKQFIAHRNLARVAGAIPPKY